MIIILECLKGVSISLPYRKILNNTQIWQNKGDTIGTIAIPSISLQTYDPSQSQKNLAKTCKPITSYYPHQNRAILIVCSGFPKFYIHFLCLKLTTLFTNYEKFNGKNQRNYFFPLNNEGQMSSNWVTIRLPWESHPVNTILKISRIWCFGVLMFLCFWVFE